MVTLFQVLGIISFFNIAIAVSPQCQTSPCTNGGTCFVNATTNAADCYCPTGFTGPTCAQIDLCPSNTCLNGGTCLPVVANLTYQCNCLPGFTGHNCATMLHPCRANPCQNGTCNDIITSYTCNCFPGYTGVNCETYGGLCLESPCNNLDTNAQCTNDDNAYQCECSSDDYFGLNCETPSKNCQEEEESYCVCMVNNLPVKFPIPSPKSYDGINSRDVISAILGILLGWLLGTVILHLCCCCFANDIKEKKPERPWARPTSVQSNSTMSSGISSCTNDNGPLTGSGVFPPTGSPGAINKVAPADTAFPPAVKKNFMPTNVYRAAFVDELAHSVSTRKSTVTYTSGQQDW